MKQTLEQRLRGGFSKLSINRQHISYSDMLKLGITPKKFGDIEGLGSAMNSNFNTAFSELQSELAQLNNAKYKGGGYHDNNMSSVNLPGMGAQLHIHEGTTGNYDAENGQSMAHFKQDGTPNNIGNMSSYDAAMGHAYAQQMGLSTSGFNSKANRWKLLQAENNAEREQYKGFFLGPSVDLD